MPLEDRTEPATQRKREDAREEGRVAKSQDIISAVMLIVCVLLLKSAGPYLLEGMMNIVRDTLSNLHTRKVDQNSIHALMMFYMMRCGMLCLPILAATGAVGVAANVLQVGFKVTPKALAPDFKRLDPLKGMARMVSGRSFVELAKSVAKIGVVTYVVYAFVRKQCPLLVNLAGVPAASAGTQIAEMCFKLLFQACFAMLVIGVIDYIYQRISFENSLKMTKQEVKEEYKRTEGDPAIKGRIRQRQRDMAKRRMMQDVPKADVIITNPTRIAIAIRYDAETMAAPIVVAKGQRIVAQRIKAIAELNGIPIIENKPVARLLYKTVEIGQQIPEELFQAVAEILAYVFRLNNKAGRRRN